jgi:phage baseplate assembly protein W
LKIKIKSLEVDKITEKSHSKGYTYKDIEFDLKPAISFNNQLNRNEYLKDVQAIFDIEAIQNSIQNCFLTAPGQKILDPTFGIDLRQRLFDPVDDFTADIIQNDIEVRLPRMEPRIDLRNVVVVGDEDAQQYNVSLQIDVPSLGIYGFSIKSVLATEGYTVL